MNQRLLGDEILMRCLDFNEEKVETGDKYLVCRFNETKMKTKLNHDLRIYTTGAVKKREIRNKSHCLKKMDI